MPKLALQVADALPHSADLGADGGGPRTMESVASAAHAVWRRRHYCDACRGGANETGKRRWFADHDRRATPPPNWRASNSECFAKTQQLLVRDVIVSFDAVAQPPSDRLSASDGILA